MANKRLFIPNGILGKCFGTIGNIVFSKNGSFRAKKVYRIKPRINPSGDPSGA